MPERAGLSSVRVPLAEGGLVPMNDWRELPRRGIDYNTRDCAVENLLSVDEAGGLRLRSGAQRFYEGVIGFSFPMLFSRIADVSDDVEQCFRIVVDVHNRV